jgi:hypothetical protein
VAIDPVELRLATDARGQGVTERDRELMSGAYAGFDLALPA